MSLSLGQRFARFQFGLAARISFYRRVSAFVGDGVPLYDALSAIHARYQKNRDSRAVMTARWLENIRAGAPFAKALEGWVPAQELMLIDAGERAGDLPGGLEQAIVVSEASAKMRSALIGGISYPGVLFAILTGMVAGFSFKMVPILVQVTPPEAWPGSAKLLYSLSQVVVHQGWMILLALGGAIGLQLYLLPRFTGPLRQHFDRIPPWSLYRDTQGAAFLIALAAMMRAGIPLADAIRRMRDLANPWTDSHLQVMLARLRAGVPNGEALNTGITDPETAGDIVDYGRLSSFERAMSAIGGQVVDRGIKRISAGAGAMRTVMIILVGITLGWIYWAFYTLTSGVSQGVAG